MNIMKSLPNLKSLDSRKETQSNYNQYHQKINIQDDEKIQLHSQEAKQEQVTVPILKESEMVNYAQKQNVDNMSVASQDFKIHAFIWCLFKGKFGCCLQELFA